MSVSKKQHVVDTATSLFSQHGFHPVGVDWIIEASGVARMTMYRNFNGKEDLVKTVLTQRSSHLIEQLKTRMDEKPSLEEKIISIFDWRGQWFCSTSFAGCLFGRAVGEYPEHSDIREIALDYKHKLHALVEHELARHHTPDTANTLATYIMMLLDGATVNAQAFSKSHFAGDACDAALMLLRFNMGKQIR
ncbi:TetR/AcrR family transcriptional regulator [Pseudomonas huanghezhanensis]|uniref:TetR/AcrR family transcriptional regulator n=1 Tax=Pseudomonas huanghezhanensis TaxID=3002903 RepID=UPI0022865F33|nr:TetR/AcrR family transcriptional regulator [Pseudomonas sp. BSw22131]